MKRVLLLAAIATFFSTSTAFGQVNRLVPGRLATTIFPEILAPTVFNGEAGFFLDVPEGAERVVFSLSTAPRASSVDLFVRFGQDVTQTQAGAILADFRSQGPTGTERIEISINTVPAIMAGRYFVGFQAGFRNPQTFAFLETRLDFTVGASDLIEIASSNFEGGAAAGWTRNYPALDPEIMIPGSTVGAQDSTLRVIRNSPPDSRALAIVGSGDDYFVAAPDFLGNLLLLGSDARLEFQLRYQSDDFPTQNIEVRLLGQQSVFVWSTSTPTRAFSSYAIPLREGSWRRLTGVRTWSEVLRNVQRIEIRANYSTLGGTAQIDNFMLLGRPPVIQTPVLSDFSSGEDGWTKNVHEPPFFIPRIPGITTGDRISAFMNQATDGNPGGFLLISERQTAGDINRDYVIAPEKFLGNWSQFSNSATLEFDRRHISPDGATRAVEVRLFGFGAAFLYAAPRPTANWTHITIPLDGAQWTTLAGGKSFKDALRTIQRIEISMDEVSGVEDSGLDNVLLFSPPALIPELTSDRNSLYFRWVQGEAVPIGQPIRLTSNGPSIQWIGAASAGAPWIRANPARGASGEMLLVEVDPTGLERGFHEGFLEVAWPNREEPLRIAVSIDVLFPTTPRFSQGGVVNSADFTPNQMAGGQLTGGMFAAFFGEKISQNTVVGSTVPFATELDGTRITLDGIPISLVFVSPLQAVGVIPQQLIGGTAVAVISRNNDAGPPERIRLGPVQPKLFSVNQSGSGPGAIQNSIGGGLVQLNTFDDPATRTQSVIIFGTGFGPTAVPVADGQASAQANPVTGRVRVTIGGVNSDVPYAGYSPGSPHLYQANAIVHPNSPLGCEIPVQVFINDVPSNEVTMAITGNAEPCR